MLKIKKPVTPSLRHHVQIKNSELNKKVLVKNLLVNLKKSTGTNKLGTLIAYHKGGGHKQRYRKIDFNRKSLCGIVTSLEYDPYRNCFIASVFDFGTKKYSYILAPKNLNIGDILNSGKKNINPNLGNLLKLNEIPLSSYIHNVELKINKGGQLIRSAGCFAQLIQKYDKQARIKLNSGEYKLISLDCSAVIGLVSNNNFNLINIGKAGRNRWLNKRPKVRGVAMNPVDHPNGGGEGKTSGKKNSVSPWGKTNKGRKTRKKILNNVV